MTFGGLGASDLWALFAIAGGAMVLLYLLKLRRRRVEVPYSPLWARVVEDKQSTSLFKRLKRVFSLLVQLMVVAAIVLALGDPKLAGLAGCSYSEPERPPPRHTLLMIDASASMATVERGRTRLSRARAEAHAVADALRGDPDHRVMVVQLDARTRPLTLWTSDADAVAEAIDAVAPAGALDTPTAVDDALRLAADALRGREEAEVVLVTDAAFPPVDAARVEELRLRVVRVGAPGVNVGVQAFNVRPYLDDSLTYSIFYAIGNQADRPLPATLFLYANDQGQSVDDFIAPARIVASYALTLPAGGVLEDVIPDVKFEGSRLAARVEIAASDPARDVFPRDDVAFALVPERKLLKVQLVSQGNLFLHASLFVRENVALTSVTPAEYAGPEGFDVTIVDAGVGVDVSRPGDYLLIAPAADLPGSPFEVTGVVSEPHVGRVAKRHPIARDLQLVDLNILEATVLAKARGDQVVVASKGGAPLLLTRVDAEGGRRFVALAFDVRKSLLPLNYAFPLLMVNALSWFHQEEAGLLKPRRAGVEVSVPVALEGAGGGGALTVAGPPGAPPVHARQIGERVLLSAQRVGVYELSWAGVAGAQPVAINLMSPAESRVSPREAGYPAWEAPAPVVRERDRWLSSFWRVLLLVALGLVVLEWLTWHRRVTV
ncbi:MAG: hypothetical protein CSA66_06690 [Proteobacteria bacterium]|nr:MAG: hypothetical protein CSA66_06690 [Pseudomonadota bacterium]